MAKDIYAALAKRIRELRKQAELSIEQLAELAGIGAGFLAHIETDQKKPSVATLGKLADALHVPVATFFKGGPQPGLNADHRVALQLTELLSSKSPAQRKAIIKTVRALAKTFPKV